MSRSVVARVAMSRSAALSNMCSMFSYPNGPVQAKRPAGAGYLLCWNGRLRWWLRNGLGGWLGTSDACGWSPWQGGSGRPPESAQKRGAFHRIPLPHFRPDLTRRTRPGTTKATPATVNTHRRTATPPTKGETSPRTHPSRNPRGGTQPRDPTQPVPCPSSPPVAPVGTAPTHRSRTNPGHRTDRAGTRPRDPIQPVPRPSSPPRHPSGDGQPTDPGPTPATERTELEPDPGTQPSQPRAPRRCLVTPAGTAPTHRSRTNPGHRTDRAGTRPRDPTQPAPRPSSPPRHPSGDRANPPIPDQPRQPNGPSWKPTPGPDPASPAPLVAASSPQRGPRQPTDPGPTPATERTELEP